MNSGSLPRKPTSQFIQPALLRHQGHKILSIRLFNLKSMLHFFKKLLHRKEKMIIAPSQRLDLQHPIEYVQDASNPFLKLASQTPDWQQPVDDPHDIFHPYTRLAAELRLKIWAHYLEDEIPQVYRFTLRYPVQSGTRGTRFWDVKPDHKIFLQPVKVSEGESEPTKASYLEPLQRSSKLRRIASKTCVEARQVVLKMFPDTLQFRLLPPDWGDIRGSWSKWRIDGKGFPEHTIRFNGTKDIIVFNANWVDQAWIAKIASGRDSPVDHFAKLRHVAMAVESMESIVPEIHVDGNGKWSWGSSCTWKNCENCEQKDPTASFLALFPLMKTFYLADIPSPGAHRLDEEDYAGHEPPPQTVCRCPENGSRHAWPTIKSSGAYGWFVAYDERSGCPFPKISTVEKFREVWQPEFPYSRVPERVAVRFIQPMRRECLGDLRT